MEEVELTIEGQTVDGRYTIGDTIEANLMGHSKSWAILKGKITKIFHAPGRGIYQLQVNNGWWCHPNEFYGRDEVVVIEKYKAK